MSNPQGDGLQELAQAFAQFVGRARRAPLTRRERERLVEYVKRNADRIAPAPKREVSESESHGSAAWQDLGYR